MKVYLLSSVLLLCFMITSDARADLIMTAIYDGFSSSPKGVELHVLATGSYAGWTLDTEFNENVGFSTAYTFDSTVYTAGSFLYVTSTATDATLVGLAGTIISDGSFVMNGDDRVRLTNGSIVIDQYGVSGVDGTGQAWEYLDSFATRKSFTSANGAFSVANWNVRTVDSLDAGNGPLTGPSGLGTFQVVPEPGPVAILLLAGAASCLRRRR